jgi:hypothetical protein
MHGDFATRAGLVDIFLREIHEHVDPVEVPSVQLHGLRMIVDKISRIVCGDSGFVDHWRDIAGYATLVADNIEQQAAKGYVTAHPWSSPSATTILSRTEWLAECSEMERNMHQTMFGDAGTDQEQPE